MTGGQARSGRKRGARERNAASAGERSALRQAGATVSRDSPDSRLFEEAVRPCMQATLVGGEDFAIDASVIEADASRNRKVDGKLTASPDEEKVTRPVRE